MSYLVMILLISLLVILHEVGHMVVAKRCGVKVERFGLGLPFGPPLLEKEWKGIKWCIHAVPLGGYVSFPDDSEESEVPADSPERFENQPLLNQAAIAMAGITVNAIIAVVLMVAVLGIWGAQKSQLVVSGFSPVFEQVAPLPEPAPKLAFYENGVPVYTAGLTPLEVSKRYQGLQLGYPAQTVTVAPVNSPERTLLKIQSSPAAAAGLQVGDVLLAAKAPTQNVEKNLEGYYAEPTRALPEFLNRFDASAGEMPITLELGHVDRLATDVPLVETASETKSLTLPPSRKMGIYMGLIQQTVPVDFFTNVGLSVSVLNNMVVQNFIGLGKLVTGQISPQMLDGPVGVVRVGGELIERAGIQSGLWLTAVISIILAVMNLLPFPPLDGSYLIYIGYEAMTRRPFPAAFKQGLNMAGFFLLMGLMIFVLGNDIFKLFQS